MSYWVKKILILYLATEFGSLAYKHSFRTFNYLIYNGIHNFENEQNKWFMIIKIVYLINVFILFIDIIFINLTNNIWIKLSCHMLKYSFYIVLVIFSRHCRNNIVLIDWQPEDVLFIQDINEIFITAIGLMVFLALMYKILDNYGFQSKFQKSKIYKSFTDFKNKIQIFLNKKPTSTK